MTLVSYTNIEDGVSADANVWNSRYGDILAVLNGNIDASNIKNGSITRELFASDAISAAWPVGSIYISVENVNPGPQLGGTWVAFATGRTLVGVDPAQTEFDDAEKTGGVKDVTLTEAQMPSHNHTGNTNTTGNHSHGYSHPSRLEKPIHGTGDFTHGFNDGWYGASTGAAGNHSHSFTTANKGGGQAHTNLQPFITVYFWKRIS